ncbi:MAG TPA: hypothetical protein VK191_11655 [Symbiobacteriaceae bacterium]|nr:hypothetical protein [Symbiobacteriaceae bacterium]
MALRNPVIPEQIQMANYPRCLSLNSRGELYANPRALFDLESCIARPTDWLVYDQHDAMTFALHFIPKQVDGAVHVRRSTTKTTALFGAGPILALLEYLRVKPGRIREIDYTVQPVEGEDSLFILHCGQQKNRPAKKRGPRPPK